MACLGLSSTETVHRFLADAPTAHGERVRKLLPQLLAMHGGRALPFLGPALSQLALPPLQDDDAAELQLWQALLRSRQVLPHLCRSDCMVVMPGTLSQRGTMLLAR